MIFRVYVYLPEGIREWITHLKLAALFWGSHGIPKNPWRSQSSAKSHFFCSSKPIVNGVLIEWVMNCLPLTMNEFHGFPLVEEIVGSNLWIVNGIFLRIPRYFPTLLSHVVQCRPPLLLQTLPPECRQRLLHEQLLLLLTSLLQPRTWKTIHKQVDNNVASWLVCGPPPNYFWTLFKVESQKFSSQKKNISSIK